MTSAAPRRPSNTLTVEEISFLPTRNIFPMAPVPYATKTKHHYIGASREQRKRESDSTSKHRFGCRNHEGRQAGSIGFDEEYEEGRKDYAQVQTSQSSDGALYNIRDVLKSQPDYVQKDPEEHPIAARFVLNVTESEVKGQRAWPANIEKARQEAEETKKKKQGSSESSDESEPALTSDSDREDSIDDNSPDEFGDKSKDKSEGQEYARNVKSGQKDRSNKATPAHDKPEAESQLSEADQHFLEHLQLESKHMAALKPEDGLGKSPLSNYNHRVADIDEQDQNTPDNWIPRSLDLIRQTGNHPLNAEPQLSKLFKAGLITPNKLHYVRNHGPVPRLNFETHKLHVYSEVVNLFESDINHCGLDKEYQNGRIFSMQQLVDMDHINISVALACDGNRRGELNKIKRSKGFDWGCGAISNAYWKGPTVKSILEAAGLKDSALDSRSQLYVHFEGSDMLSEGRYATSIAMDYILNSENDVLLALCMNDVPLAPDHGYPIRLIIPGFVGGRMVKWLEKIWISDQPSDNYYHIWDNRVLPSFVTEKDGPWAETMFHHPDTACMEQNLNSVIARPAHKEELILDHSTLQSESTYRLEGYAYDGGGHMVQKVEVSLDGGQTWLYAYRRFPDKAFRHGRKFWTWCHWYCDVKFVSLLRAKDIKVRAWNVFKNTQPEKPTWNLMGMMNNCVYTIKQDIQTVQSANTHSSKTVVTYCHPINPGNDDGWMKPSTEIQLAAAKQSAAAPAKRFTSDEIRKHDNKEDCWIVINDTVYDATSVLKWHPGGAHAILNHAGKLSHDTSEQYNSIHDDFANHKLQECAIGIITDKAKKRMQEEAAALAKEIASQANDSVVLKKHIWTLVELCDKKMLDKDTRLFTFRLPGQGAKLDLPTGKHVLIGFHFEDKMVFRSYTPTRPILESEEDGTFDVVVKIYFPNEKNPGGTLSNVLDSIEVGEKVDIRGPTGEIEYKGQGNFDIEGNALQFKQLNLIGGGSGVTPHYQLIHRILGTREDRTEITFFYCNSTEEDILLRSELESLAKKHSESFHLVHVLSHPSDEWKGERGHISAEILKKHMLKDNAAAFLCGPPAMIKSAHDFLIELDFEDEKNLFAF